MLSILAHSSLEVHCSYRLKLFVAKNHLRSSSPSNCSLLCNRFARSCSPRPSQSSKYTEGVALRMRICIAVQRLSRKWVQKKILPARPYRTASAPTHFDSTSSFYCRTLPFVDPPCTFTSIFYLQWPDHF